MLIDDVNKFGEKHKCKNQKYTGYKEHDIDWTKYSIDKIKKLIGKHFNIIDRPDNKRLLLIKC